MANTPAEIYDELDSIMGRIICVLEGAYCVAEWLPNKNTELTLITIAQELCKKADGLTEQLYKARWETPKEQAVIRRKEARQAPAKAA